MLPRKFRFMEHRFVKDIIYCTCHERMLEHYKHAFGWNKVAYAKCTLSGYRKSIQVLNENYFARKKSLAMAIHFGCAMQSVFEIDIISNRHTFN